MLLTLRSKNATEILIDATLVVYYKFDVATGIYDDSGPLYINGTGTDVSSVSSGRINEALLFGSSTLPSYYQFQGLTALGTANQAFSISLWINPSFINGSVILHVNGGYDTTGIGLPGWCIPFIGISSSGHVVVQSWIGSIVSVLGPVLLTNSWIHIVETWSATNGLRLYVNGTLNGSTAASTYSASGHPDTITLGNSVNATNISCTAGLLVMSQFFGLIDEFQLYSRELNTTDVYSLANP
ncbi:unnamed protein product [Didymodactylos carnosus]|uniref:LamG domain-containing protein n=1 Tax=Didymodactylos carnosus TaxID=1234261 RepID=A0A8S2FB04_9BILA|nr:unnamed protein product [Didymodactylos carnosus]CAF4212356.1 unnamed protein product [Didymodactylos carnosus]